MTKVHVLSTRIRWKENIFKTKISWNTIQKWVGVRVRRIFATLKSLWCSIHLQHYFGSWGKKLNQKLVYADGFRGVNPICTGGWGRSKPMLLTDDRSYIKDYDSKAHSTNMQI